MVVVYSKEKPLHCGNCKERLETACFRCSECGEIVSCPSCDPRGGFQEDRDRPPRPFVFDHHHPCPRGGLASRGRSFDAPCPRDGFNPRGGFSPRGGSFDHLMERPMHRPNFSTTVPFPGADRGRGFGPRGFGGFPPRCPFPTSFGPMSEQQGGIIDHDNFSEMHARGGFGPFTPRGREGFSRGFPGRGMARGRGRFSRGRGGLSPFSGFQGMGCGEGGECNHQSVFPEKVIENIPDANGGAGVGEENIADAKEGAGAEPVCVDHA